jgi:type II secretory pathway predicted ATPase ExeA
VNTKKALAFYGLKWNPFTEDVPVNALLTTARLDQFFWRVENLVRDGGFAMVTGENGMGKSTATRMLADRLSKMRDLVVGVIQRPQSRIADFYREIGEIFEVNLAPHNRWCGFKALREKWKNHLETSLARPVLIVDEAQEAPVDVLNELRIMSSTIFDSSLLLTTIIAGDRRLPELLKAERLVSLGSRLRARLFLEPASREELLQLLEHALAKAGNPKLMTRGLMETLADHALGNYRVLMNTALELFLAGAKQEATQLDEKLFLETFKVQTPRRESPPARKPS